MNFDHPCSFLFVFAKAGAHYLEFYLSYLGGGPFNSVFEFAIMICAQLDIARYEYFSRISFRGTDGWRRGALQIAI
jgi:hypothetical protein